MQTRHIVPISGKDSLTTFIVQRQIAPELPYELMFNPTGAETPEVEAWLQKVEARYGLPIARVGRNLEEIIDEHGILPSIRVRFCTRESKIYPMEDWIGKDPAIVYYGIRADEQRQGYIQTKKTNITPVYPLVTAGITLMDVWAILEKEDLLPPLFFWQSMWEMVKHLLGEYAPVLDTLSKPEKAHLFAGRSRANCSFCFFQRSYEWVWLLETHPDLFWHAAEIEETTGAAGYTWQQGRSLRDVAAKAGEIKARRAMKITKQLLPQQQTLALFDEDDAPDLLQVVSCGLFCGK